MRSHKLPRKARFLEGIVAKRKDDPYTIGVTWYKIKNPAYTQMEGRGICLTGLAEGCDG